MRISGGAARGIPLEVPPGSNVRPATDSLRQSVFSALAARVPGSRFLDLFAGSGSFGLEALSRGAAGGVFVEMDPKAILCIRQNLAAVCKSLRRGEEGLAILRGDVLSARSDDQPPPDLIFIDPPFGGMPASLSPVFARLEAFRPAREAIVVLKLPGDMEYSPPGWTCLKRLGSDPVAAFFAPASVSKG